MNGVSGQHAGDDVAEGQVRAMVALVESQARTIDSLKDALAEAEVRLARRADLDQLVMHEVGNPLAEVVDTLETLGSPTGMDRAVRDHLVDYAAHQARRAAEVVEGLLANDLRDGLTLSRNELEPTDLRAIFDRALRSLPQGVAVRVGVAVPERTHLTTSRLRLTAAVVNLVENAAVHGGDGPISLTAVWHEEDGTVEVRVADTGPGLRGRNLEPSNPEAGLGLYLVHRLVGSLGGRLTVSERETGGVLASIRIPQRRESDALAPVAASALSGA